MRLAEFAVKNSLLIHLLSAFLAVGGIISMFQLKRDAFPNVSWNVVMVQTVFPGATPEDVEKLITIPLEKEIKAVNDIEEMTSTSEEGLSSITIKLEQDLKNTQKAYEDIRRAVDRVKDIPEEAEDPEVLELNSKEFPILEISLNGNIDELKQREYAESLEDHLLEINGVAKVTRIGWRDREFRVEADPAKLAQYYVSLEEMMDALKERNIAIPAGRMILSDKEFYVRTTGEFTTPQEIEEVVIRSNDAGYWLKIKDVARVIDTFEDETRIAKVNGKRAIAMVVVKKESADTLDLADEVKETIAEFKAHLPEGVDVTLTNDFSYYVERRLGVIKDDGFIGFFLVVAILFLFMDPLPAFLTALGIPFALFTTFVVMNMFGISINLVTMLGLIIVLGMLVDEEIVIAENVYRYMEEGMSPHEATIKGAHDVAGPVIVTILTAFAAFAPLMFVPDLMGKFIRSIPIIVMISLAASLVEALVVLPSHLAEFVKIDKLKSSKSKAHRKWLYDLTDRYALLLKKAVNHRYWVTGGLIAFTALTVVVAVLFLKVILFTGEGIEEFYIRAEAAQGTSLQKMNELIVPVEELISKKIPASELSSFRTFLGSIEEEGGFDPNAKRGSHLGQITVFLTPMQHRKREPQEIIDSLRPQLEEIQGFEKLYFYKPKEGPPVGRPVSIAIKGDDYSVLQTIAAKFTSALEAIKGASDISTSYHFGKKQLKVVINEEKARSLHLSIDAIARAVRNAHRGGVATSIRPSKAEKEIDVVVRFPEADRYARESFDKIMVPNRSGKLIPLKSVAAIEETEGVFVISHLEGKRVIWVSAEVDNENATSFSVNHALQQQFKSLPKEFLGYYIKYSGEFEEQKESMIGLLISFSMALFLIFIILAAMFKSLLQPFIVMMAIPFGIIGVIWAFLAHGRPLSFFALMGLVGLTGIVVNDSVVLVEFINKLRREGKGAVESILEAGRLRFRPILMTALTTISGLVAVAYGIGGGDPFLRPLALAMVWGLTFSSTMTLLVLPCIYAIFDDFIEKILHKHMVKADAAAAGSV